jgi:hypothetical protein
MNAAVHEHRRASTELVIGTVPVADVPMLSPAVRDCLRRQSRHQPLDALAGSSLWVPRIGLSVLVHRQLNAEMWACTAVATDHGHAHLPVGLLLLSSLELSRAPAALARPRTLEEFCAAWQVQVIDRGVPLDFTTALIETLDPADRTVNLRAPGLARRSGCRVTSGLERRRQQLVEMKALRPINSDWAELVLPGPVWTW